MSKKMNWGRAAKDNKPKLSIEQEAELLDADRAGRWLAAVEGRVKGRSTATALPSKTPPARRR